MCLQPFGLLSAGGNALSLTALAIIHTGFRVIWAKFSIIRVNFQSFVQVFHH
jgi:hypothetical protein